MSFLVVVLCISSRIRRRGETVYDHQALIHARTSRALDVEAHGPAILASMDAIDPFPPSDPLGEALHFLRMNGAFYCRSELTAPWGLTMPPMPGYVWFHVVTSGRFWLEAGESASTWMGL